MNINTLNDFIDILLDIYNIKDKILINNFKSMFDKFNDSTKYILINNEILKDHLSKLMEIDKKLKLFLNNIKSEKLKNRLTKLIDEFNKLQILILIDKIPKEDPELLLLKAINNKKDIMLKICFDKIGGSNKYILRKI